MNLKRFAGCPLCGSETRELIGDPRIEEKFLEFIDSKSKVVQCGACGFYYVHPSSDVPGSVWEDVYDDKYFPEASRIFYRKRQRELHKRIKKLEKICSPRIEKFLDIGSGEGLALHYAWSRGNQAHGIDVADNRKESARKESITFQETTLLEAGLEENHYDCVYMDSVLEHVRDPMGYLHEIYRVLKEGGVCYIGVPNEDSLFNDIKQAIDKIRGRKYISPKIKPFSFPYHINGFNKKSLLFAVKEAGFQVVKLRNFACRLEFILQYKFLSRQFLKGLILFPLHLAAIPLRREYYLEIFLKK